MTKRFPALLAALAVAALAAPGAAEEADDARAARERVQEQQSAVTAEIDVLQAQDAELEAALAELQANVAAEQALLAEVEQAAVVAEQRLAAADAAVAATTADIEEQEADLRRIAVQAYVRSGAEDPALLVLRSDDAADAAQRFGLMDLVAGDIDEVVERLEATRRQLTAQRRAAAAADRAADARRAEAEDRLGRVTAAREAHQAFAAEVEARIEAKLSEAAALAQLDAELGEELRRQQEVLVARARAAASSGAAGTGTASLVDPDDLVGVRGITVHVSIADALEDLLAAAEADGIELGGGGFRSSASQIALREANCPDVWDAPASVCAPPTARPGYSLHEQGLAVDFTYEGRAIPTPSSPAFVWLDANAERFGFYNLPSEPWHWSTTGS